MSTIKIETLLEQWIDLIDISEEVSREKAGKNNNGLSGRIKRTTGNPIIFDLETHRSQKTIQNLLCQELPQWADLVRSQPDIMDGYQWTRKDFIDLYFGHFRLIIEKLQQIINQITEDNKNNEN